MGKITKMMVFIQGGTFMMGCPEGENCFPYESPQHQVTVSDFYIGRYPVTNEEYDRFLEATGAKEPAYWADRKFNQPKQPVVGVSWDDVQAYAKWAGLRLPTEAEWEYACRAETQTRYYTGDSVKDLDRAGWYDSNSGSSLHPVGEKEPNAFGLYDMHGNVYEWCQDWFGNYPSKMVTDPAGPENGSYRVLRGGSWSDFAQFCRSAYRYADYPSYRNGSNYGFRLAFSPGQKK